MAWKVVRKKLGKAENLEERIAQQQEWDHQYGEDNWQVGYIVEGEFISREKALETIYYRSYEEHFQQHPEDRDELISLAKTLRNPRIEITGDDMQIPAIMNYLARHHLALKGTERVDIGAWQGKASHLISIRLSPDHVKLYNDPKLTLEKFWQSKKCLAVWEFD